MGKYSITFARSARKELEELSSQMAERIIDRIEALSVNPRPPGVVKLQGNKNLWRVRVGDYRVVYSIDDDEQNVDVCAVRNRRDVYRDF